MKCVKPFVTTWAAHGCGQCLPCRVTRARTWTHRILLEVADHGERQCCFVTLTYEKDRVNLEPSHIQRWLKRFRKRVAPARIRYFAVGEYGDISWRPHYHVALFGWPPCSGGRRTGEACQCPACSVVRETWGFGHVMVGRLEAKSARYIAGYCTKKMTHASDTRLGGRLPEFARMSTNPGLGVPAMHNVASAMLQYNLDGGDVPTALRHGSKMYPLGKTLRRKLRSYVGKPEHAPKEALQEAANKLSIVRAYAWQNDVSVSSVIEEINQPHADALAGRQSLRGKKL